MQGEFYYYDIGDYLNREEKLKIVADFKSIHNLPLKTLHPNQEGDWINQRNKAFENFMPVEPKKKFDTNTQSFFNVYSLGTATNRDTWVYNFSLKKLKENIIKTIQHYYEQLENFKLSKIKQPIRDTKKGNWTDKWLDKLKKRKCIFENIEEYRLTLYRPFTTLNSYFDDDLNQRRYQLPKIFPTKNSKNILISLTGLGANKGFSSMITNKIPDLQLLANGQCFPLYYYEKKENTPFDLGLYENSKIEYTRRDGVSDFILKRAKEQYGKTVSKEDIFYYVYGILHSPQYRETFANDLKKMLPRIPLVAKTADFWAFSKAGQELAALHLNYEKIPSAKEVLVLYDTIPQEEIEKSIDGKKMDTINYTVQKMQFGKKQDENGKKVVDKSKIIYNDQITLEDIPLKAYEYVVNGKSAIEWVMDRYQLKTDKKSGITNNPNDWCEEVNNEQYILNLLLSVINVSVQTVDIVEGLPALAFEED